jgi:nicotinic acid mononucleotide adenylyltransferase
MKVLYESNNNNNHRARSHRRIKMLKIASGQMEMNTFHQMKIPKRLYANTYNTFSNLGSNKDLQTQRFLTSTTVRLRAVCENVGMS